MMASMITAGESSSQKSQWKYDVFLSFRGKDTRAGFTDHLYNALKQKGIYAYRDDPSLEKGRNISELLGAIEDSKCLIVIISANYASSTWCLEELAKIVECTEGGEQIAIPIFYNVEPSDVRKQGGSFQSAFLKHEADFKDDMDMVQRWRSAMTKIANRSGRNSRERQYESQLIKDITENLQKMLNKEPHFHFAPKDLVGMESRVGDMLLHLSLGSDDVRIVGIHGMGGIGKSTLARAVLDEIGAQFDGCSFLANIREGFNSPGLVHFQNKLLFDVLQEKDMIKDEISGIGVIKERLRHKRVLLVLDDVDRIDELEKLASKSCFGPGSRILITTRNEHLLKISCDAIYKAKELSNEEALKLFCLRAFRENNTTEEFADLSERVIEYAKGLPLALIVLGSFLLGRSISEWKSALGRIQNNPDKQVFESLRLSFDGLHEKEKEIFLDIACFFIGDDKDYVMKILDCCGFYPEIGVQVLIEKSLLTVIDNGFMVHDLLQEMAWEVVRQESPKEPGKRSRLRLYEDIYHVMTNNTGTERIEGIILKPREPDEIETKETQIEEIREREELDANYFFNMTNLRLLVIYGDRGTFKSSNIKSLSNKLRFLRWDFCPLSYLPENFLPKSLYELQLVASNLRRLWRGQKILEKLKHVNMSYSRYLEETPDFKMMPNLEKLDFTECMKLSKIHPSIGVLHNLKFLNLRYCVNLRKLPPSIGNLISLKDLDLRYCSKLEKLPDSIGNLESVENLDISYTAIASLPPSLRNLKNLKILYCCGCKGMQSDLKKSLFLKARNARGMFLPSVSGLSSLEVLNISNCHLQEGGIPNDLGCLSSLRELHLDGNYFFTIPESINHVPWLKLLTLNRCENLRALPTLPESILYVEFRGCMKLNSISNLFMVTNHRGLGDPPVVSLLNCLKLLPEDLEIPLAQKNSLAFLCYIIGCLAFRDTFGKSYVVAPNCEIPEWFTYREDGSLLSFHMRDLGRFKDDVSGFAICASFVRQEQESSDPKHVKCSSGWPKQEEEEEEKKCSYDLYSEFKFGSNQVGCRFDFSIRFIESNCLWMGFVSLRDFQDDTNWEERIDVSLRTQDDQLKVIRCGVLPLQQHNHLTIKKFIQSASSSPEDLSSILHEVAVYPDEVDCHFSSNGDNKERRDHREFRSDAVRCKPHFYLPGLYLYYLWWKEIEGR